VVTRFGSHLLLSLQGLSVRDRYIYRNSSGLKFVAKSFIACTRVFAAQRRDREHGVLVCSVEEGGIEYSELSGEYYR